MGGGGVKLLTMLQQRMLSLVGLVFYFVILPLSLLVLFKFVILLRYEITCISNCLILQEFSKIGRNFTYVGPVDAAYHVIQHQWGGGWRWVGVRGEVKYYCSEGGGVTIFREEADIIFYY